jgi:hypothetical protein
MMHLDKSVVMYMYIDIVLLTIILYYNMNMFCLDLLICRPVIYLFSYFYCETQVSLVTTTKQHMYAEVKYC